MRHSVVRDRIYDYLCLTDTHPSAEMIYHALKSEIPQLSIGTVYRNLRQFEMLGKVVRVVNFHGNERYDATCQTHAHFVCDDCGNIVNILNADISAVKQACHILNETELNRIQIVFHGVCSECSEKKFNLKNL